MQNENVCARMKASLRDARGLLIPLPVRVETKTAIGKEVIVDPTDANEDLADEMLSATEV